MRMASEAHDAQQKEEAVFTQKMYGQPAGTDDLALQYGGSSFRIREW